MKFLEANYIRFCNQPGALTRVQRQHPATVIVDTSQTVVVIELRLAVACSSQTERRPLERREKLSGSLVRSLVE